MEQFSQLLTCAICLDRYRNPKLLPCQHSFCMEPCMDGLVDYVRRQLKCPECRAEHRIPYNGVQGFPNNVTLQRFLELHIEISGELPDPTANLVMERCGVCSEKAYCSLCCHCDKKVCPECKEGHLDIVKREIMRINSQIRRMLHRLQDSIRDVERSECQINQNKVSILEEIEQLHQRLQKALKDRTEYLKVELEGYAMNELKNHKILRENLEQELVNMESNCELVEKYIQDDKIEWDDCELMDTKDIFLKTMEFIRNFDYEGGDYSRRARLTVNQDAKTLVNNLSSYADINFNIPNQIKNIGHTSSTLSAPSITRSKSDHRLASQFRDYELSHGESDLASFTQRRPFGERSGYKDRYGGDKSYGGDDDYLDSRPRSRFRSRFTRNLDTYDTDDYPSSRRVSCVEPPLIQSPQVREKVIDTEDVTRGPLSGVTRLSDSPRVMQRLQDSVREKKVEKVEVPVVQPKPQVVQQPKKASRQVSEEDEISKIKKQNKAQETAKVDETKQESVPPSRRTSVEKKDDSSASARTSTEREDSSSSASRRRSRTSAVTRVDSIPESTVTTDTTKTYQRQRSSKDDKPSEITRKYSRTSSSGSLAIDDPDSAVSRVARRLSCESTSSESSSRSSPIRNTGAAFSTEEIRSKFSRGSGSEKETSVPRSRLSSQSSVRSNDAGDRTRPRFQSRFLGRAGTPTAEASKESESESETDETSESDTESEEEKTIVKKDTPVRSTMAKTDIGPLLARSTQARESKIPERITTQKSREEEKSSPFSRSRTTSSLYNPSSRDRKDTTESPTYSPRNSTYSSKDYSNLYSSPRDSYGNSSDSSSYRNSRDSSGYGSYGGYGRDRDTGSSYSTYGRDQSSSSGNRDLGSSYARRPSYLGVSGTGDNHRDDSDHVGYSRYRNRSRGNVVDDGGYQSKFLNKSKSSAALGPDPEPMKISDDSYYPSGRSRYAAIRDRRSRIARSKSSADLGNNPDDSGNNTYYNSNGEQTFSDNSLGAQSFNTNPENKDLSTWARYLKSKYGSKKKDELGRRASLGFLGTDSPDSTDSENKMLSNQYPNSPSSPIANLTFNTPRAQYLQKGPVSFRFGSRGSEPGRFTWPRGIAVGPDNSIVVADSSNHRVQVFNPDGVFLKEFGSYGNAEGEFDCLAGLAVNRIGQFIIADRYNHRIQVFDPSGRFLRCFGNQGSADGRFSYPWGVTTDALGFIYVCDKENHRVQVFQSDGTFVGKFGTLGNGPGELEHPHYIAVSSTNRVIVSDSNNHRIQIFDVNGQLVSSFGSEGSAEGQFKFPRGIAVDDNGYIFVSDSGNNRIQIFHPDGAFLNAFGTWGSGDGEFKGLEGIAVMSNGNILVCDRENHRVQVF